MNRHRCGRMIAAAILAVAQVIVVTSYPNAYGQSEAPQGRGRRGINHHISKHESISLDVEDTAARVRRDGQLTIASASHNFQIELTPHDLRASDYRAIDAATGGVSRRVETSRVRTFKGKAMGTEAEARFTIDEETVEGVIITADEKYFVEPLRKYEPNAEATDFVLYKGSDVYHDESEECGVTLEHKAENAYENLAARSVSDGVPEIAAAMTYRELELATEADYEYVTALGGAAAANNEILSILNQVEGIYKAELNISFKVSYQSTWSRADDPYTQEESAKILEEFRAYWNSNHSDVGRDLAHLWTGKDIYTMDSAGNRNTSNVGVAYTAVTCKSLTYGYGLTERRTGAASKVRVTAHEIGHNFGASHASGTGCDNTIMSAVGSPSTVSTFCQFSRDEINVHLNAYGGCLAVATDAAPTTIQLSAPTYSSDEGSASAIITVTRTGNAANAATVDYATSDQSPLVNCATVTNLASARCDYATSVDTLRFEANETTKTLSVPIIDDGFQEGSENFNIALANPTGATLGAQTSATITITDNDSVSDSSNIIDSTPFFVRLQYLDFLSREPEPDGFNAWTNLLNGCSNVNNDLRCDRITVSASFFGSQEFQLKGYFVYRFYKVSFGRLPLYNEITADMRAVTGQTGDEVVQKKTAFTDAWATRTDFQQTYPSNLSPQAFVDQLERTSGVVFANKAQLVGDLTSGANTRSQVVRAVVESAEVNGKFYNEAFVAMQYFGYLKRDPETEGFNAWLRVINANPSDARTMVDGFMNSTEYRGRFGKP